MGKKNELHVMCLRDGRPRGVLPYGLAVLCILAVPVTSSSRANSALKDPAGVLLEIGEQKFTMGDFLLHLRQINPSMEFARLPAEEQRRLTDEFVARKLLAFRAREGNLDRDPEVRARIEFFADGVLVQEFKDRLLHQIAVTDEEVASYYRSHLEEFRLPPRALLQHLLYKSAQKAARARERLRQGAAFADMAQEKNSDPDLLLVERAWFTPALLIPDLADVAFKMREGEVGEVIHSRHGFHVLRLESREEARTQDLGAVRSEVVGKVRQAKAGLLYEEVLREIKERPQVRLHLERLDPSEVERTAR